MDAHSTGETGQPARETGRARAIALVGAGAILAGIVGWVWVVASQDEDGLREVVTVDAAGDTLVYSGPVRDAIARARIVEAFNSVAAPDTSAAADWVEGEAPSHVEPGVVEEPEHPARSAREAAVDALARLYTDDVEPEAILAALHLAILDFAPGTATLPSDAPAFLQAAAEVLQRAPDDVVLVVIGHADGGPGEDADRDLSERRARVVVDALVRGGVEEKQLRAEGRGSAHQTGEDRTEGGSITFELSVAPADESTDEDADESADAVGEPGLSEDTADATVEPGVEAGADGETGVR